MNHLCPVCEKAIKNRNKFCSKQCYMKIISMKQKISLETLHSLNKISYKRSDPLKHFIADMAITVSAIVLALIVAHIFHIIAGMAIISVVIVYFLHKLMML